MADSWKSPVELLPASPGAWIPSAYRRGLSAWFQHSHWIAKAAFAVVDQGLIAGSNFFISILVARWLRPEEYGAYTLAFSIFLIFAAVHQGLVLEPLSVLGANVGYERRRLYLGALLRIQAGLSLLTMVALGLAGMVTTFVFESTYLGHAFAGLSIAGPAILLFWLARDATYLELSARAAARGASLYALLLVTGVLLFYKLGRLSPFTAFLATAGAATAASAVLLFRSRPVLRSPGEPVSWLEVWKRHWHLGRWELGTVMMGWIAESLPYTLTGALLGVAQVGAFRAVVNLSLPISHATVAVRRLFQPYVSTLSADQGRSATIRPVRTVALVSFIGGLGFFVVVSLFSERLLVFLYDGKFAEFAYLVPWVALCVAFTGGAQALLLGLRAMQRPSSIFLVYSVEAAVSLGVSLPAAWFFGLPGMIGAGVLSHAARMIVAIIIFRRRTELEGPGAGS